MPSAHPTLHTAPGDGRASVAVCTDAHHGSQKLWSPARGHTAGGAEVRVSAQLFRGQNPAVVGGGGVVQPLVMSALCDPLVCSTPGSSILHSLLEFPQSCPLMLSSHLLLCHPLLLLPSIFPSIQVFSGESALSIKWPKYWTFSISPSNEYSGLISYRIDLFDLLDVQGTLKSLLQHHSSKASILQCSAFFMIQLSYLYMTTGKAIALTVQMFVGKVMSLLFNTLARFLIAFLPRNKHLLISWIFMLRNGLKSCAFLHSSTGRFLMVAQYLAG